MTFPRHVMLLLAVILLALTAGCGDEETTTPQTSSSQCEYREADKAAKEVDPPPGDPSPDAPTEVTVATDQGDVKISLDADKAPCAVNSFLSLAKQGFFDDTECHRLTAGGRGSLNVLQCGDPSGSSMGGPGYEFDDELVEGDPRLQPCLGQTNPQNGNEYCTYPAGTVAMANGGPDTNGSQFFLVHGDSILDNSYTVFGRMSAAGLKVVQSIAAKGVQPGTETPKEPVTITSVK